MTRHAVTIPSQILASFLLVGTLYAQEPTPAYDDAARARVLGSGEQREFMNMLERDPRSGNHEPRPANADSRTIPTDRRPVTPATTNPLAYTAPERLAPGPANPIPTQYGSVPRNDAQTFPQPNGPVTQATYVAPTANVLTENTAPAVNAPRPLAIPQNRVAPQALPPSTSSKPIALKGPSEAKPRAAAGWSGLGTIAISLSFVLILFYVVMRVLKKTMPNGNGKLSGDVVQVLGRTPFAGRQTLQVIRFGNKILLVALSPTGCDTLTEIDDPLEVDRLAGLCQQTQTGSASQSFRDLLGQISGPRAAKDADAAPVKKADRVETVEDLRARLGASSIARPLETREVRRG